MPQKNNHITELRRYHMGDMADIERLCFSQPWSLNDLQLELSNPLAFYRVCETEEGRVLGYIGTRIVHGECYITNVAVHPDSRRSGIAGRLLAALEAWATEQEISMMTLEVRESNTPARTFYGKAGFVIMGLRKNYYDLPTEDAVLMTKMLTPVEIDL